MIVMLKQWWNERNQREQYIIGIGGIVVVVLLVYILIWEPLTNHIADMRQTIMQNNSLLTWMDAAANKIERYRAQGYIKKEGAPQPILVTVEQSLMQQRLSQYVANTQQQSDKELSLSLNNVPFDTAITWLETIWKKDNIIVDKITISKTNTAGVVTMTVGLKR